ncbi:hypothetical protein A9Q99_11750 [Gammaproteobacteria bacterium 45_16_T64]|nr:hypothetical protein A9Q99_11750 [Gammaproteobacteria bacterium 45_16_T64]
MSQLIKMLLLMFPFFWAANVFAENIVVIVHKDSVINTISEGDLAGVYLKRKKRVDGQRLKVVDINNDSDIKAYFHEAVTQKTLQQLKAYWSRLIFTGKGIPPYSLDTEERVVEFVSRTPNAIGYVGKSKMNNRVKVIREIK